MYIPKSFEVTDLNKLHQVIRSHPLATLVVNTQTGLQANHIPVLLDVEHDCTSFLRGHIAKANDIWRQAIPNQKALAIFQGFDHYISPNWYPSKQMNGEVVPTWNYVAVHVTGSIHWVHDHPWLYELLDRLTTTHETLHSATPWKVSDAPEEYLHRMLNAIVGFEFKIESVEGKWKASQNRNKEDQAGTMQGLEKLGTEAAREMKKTIEAQQMQG